MFMKTFCSILGRSPAKQVGWRFNVHEDILFHYWVDRLQKRRDEDSFRERNRFSGGLQVCREQNEWFIRKRPAGAWCVVGEVQSVFLIVLCLGFLCLDGFFATDVSAKEGETQRADLSARDGKGSCVQKNGDKQTVGHVRLQIESTGGDASESVSAASLQKGAYADAEALAEPSGEKADQTMSGDERKVPGDRFARKERADFLSKSNTVFAWEALQNEVDLLEQQKKVAQLKADIRAIERKDNAEDAKETQRRQEERRQREEAANNVPAHDTLHVMVEQMVQAELKKQGATGTRVVPMGERQTERREHAAKNRFPELTAIFGGATLKSRWRTASGETVVKGYGETIQGWTVLKMNRASVVLQKGRGTKDVETRTVRIGDL